MTSCFVSYTAADSAWAEWVADVLRQAGHDVVLQATDFLPGSNFVLRMQEAASTCAHTVVILSRQFLGSRFGAAEWAAAFATDPTGSQRRVIPVAVDDVQPTGLWAPIVRVSIAGLSEDDAREKVLQAIVPVPRATPAFPGGSPTPTATATATSAPRVDVWRLPASSSNMVGRGRETETLSRCWQAGDTNIIAVGGWGGAGKTTLVANWLAELATRRYEGAESVFAWGFDGQSDGEQRATSDQFFDTLIRFLGVPASGLTTTWERCREATTQLQRSRSLVILDGLERLQHPPGPLEGTFRERVMQMFFKELAALNAGMLVVTSRLPIVDIDSYVGKTCRLVPVPELPRSESIAMLRSRGVRGEEADLSSLADEVRDHPLSLQLLSGYLQTVFNGDVRRWKDSGLSRAVASDGGTTSAIMDQYVAWFADRPELQVLQMLGLFNREVTAGELACLRAAPVHPGLNDRVAGMGRAEFAYCLAALRRAGLIRSNQDENVIDVHPLVREHFRRNFRDAAPAGYREGHRRLRNHLAAKVSDLPRTLDDCAPVIAAVWHGTRAGDNVEAYESLYLPKLAQRNHFLRDSLGAAASNYNCLAYVLEDTGGPPLGPDRLAQILGDQSLDLRMLGNTAEAVFPLTEAIEIQRRRSEPTALVNMLRHLSQLELAIGRINDACRHAQEAVNFSGPAGTRSLEAVSARTSYAHALLHAGRYADCVSALRTSGLFGPDVDGDGPRPYAERLTYYIALYRAGDALLVIRELAAGRRPEAGCRDVELDPLLEQLASSARQALTGPEDGQRHPGQLATSLVDLLSARMGLLLSPADPKYLDALDQAAERIRQIGQRPWIIESSLVRSQAMRRCRRLDAAAEALEVAERLSASDGMVPQALRCQLDRVQLDAERDATSPDVDRLRAIMAEAHRSGLLLLAHRAEDMSTRSRPSPAI